MRHVLGNPVEEVKQGIILQQVNAQGVMGSGIAKEIREKWPIVWDDYSSIIKPTRSVHPGAGAQHPGAGAQHLGKVIPVQVEPGLWVLNIVGQQFFGRDARRYTSYDALDVGLNEVAHFMDFHSIKGQDVHHPLMGCGLGGGAWGVVERLIETHLGTETALWTLKSPK